jgi:hypothetical protein
LFNKILGIITGIVVVVFLLASFSFGVPQPFCGTLKNDQVAITALPDQIEAMARAVRESGWKVVPAGDKNTPILWLHTSSPNNFYVAITCPHASRLLTGKDDTLEGSTKHALSLLKPLVP